MLPLQIAENISDNPAAAYKYRFYKGSKFMAEQNILNGNVTVMEHIISDIQEHNEKLERLDKINDTIDELSRSIEVSEREIKAETENKIKEAVASICDGYDKSITADRGKIKAVQAERDKAKMAGVKERIAKETEALHKENENLKDQIKNAFKLEGIPMFCNRRLFFVLFQRKGFLDYFLFLIIALLLCVAMPLLLCFIPEFPLWGVTPYIFVLFTLQAFMYGIVTKKLLVPHAETISGARNNKAKIAINKKKIKKITKGIRSDKNEEMYGLGEYDYNINELHDHISLVEEQKKKALEEFEKTAKQDIIAEIDGRSRERINKTKEELVKKQDEAVKLDELVKNQRIYIASNYEAYLGKEFVSLDKLQEMYSYMKTGVADTVGQALAAYRDRH